LRGQVDNAQGKSLIRDLIEPVQSDEPASALGSHVQEFAFSGDVPGFRIIM
jgi:hypothetical protein